MVLPDLTQPETAALLDRHRAFWTAGDGSLLLSSHSIARYSRLGPFWEEGMALDGPLTPDMIRPAETARRLARWLRCEGITDGDSFRLALVDSTIPWLEAILGCPIYYSVTNDTVWAETPEEPMWPPPLPDLDRNPWMRALEELTQAYSAECGARLPVGTPQLRGATDLLGAYLGPAQLCLAVRDAPHSVRAAVQTSTELCAEVTRRQARWIPPCKGGYFNSFEVWAPGATVVWSQDLCTLFSQHTYDEFFLPFDIAMSTSVKHPVLHLHTGSLRLFDLWRNVPGLALQIALDPVGPALTDVLAVVTGLQEGRPILFQVQSISELALAQATLKPQGLHLASRWPGGRPLPAEDPRFD
jgi:hypothetical protein